MADKLIEDLWRTKDAIAREHDYDLQSYVTYLRAKERPASQRVANLETEKAADRESTHL